VTAFPDEIKFACAVPIGSWHPLFPFALESLAHQNAQIEVALLDASGDSRVHDAARASGIDFAYKRTGPDAGQAAAIAEGWRNTKSDIVFWLNSDDRLLPGTLSKVAEAFRADAAADVVFGGADFINDTGNVTGRHDQVADVTELLLRSNTISQPSCFARRKAVERVGGVDESLHYVMDWDLWIRLHQSGAAFKRLDQTLSAVYMGDGTKTGLISAQRLGEVFSLVKKNAGRWAAIKSTLSLGAETLAQRWSTS
jgi:GT2 family glycosyltransferase